MAARASTWRGRLRHAAISPYALLVGVALLIVVSAADDWDVNAAVAAFDRAHEGWYIDELVMGAFAGALASVIRWGVLLKQEIGHRGAAEAEAIKLARHDPLTGLPNRRLLQGVLGDLLRFLPHTSSIATMIVDLDRFKAVNDIYGHAAGDELLCDMVTRFGKALPEQAVLARLGGDEFAVVLPTGWSREEIARAADRIVCAAAEPFHIEKRLIDVGASVGIAVAPADGSDVSAVLRAADVALYRAKDAGRGTWRFFEPAMDLVMREQAELKSQMREAIVQGQIVPYYQPTIDLATRAVNGFEVLARWQHPTRGLLVPDKFIPLAEEMHLISQLTLALLERVSIDAKTWPEGYRIAFNVSPTQLKHPESIAQIGAAIARSGIRPSRFEVEITEGALIHDAEQTYQVLTSLRRMGVTLALDDFGTGYSSLSQLRAVTFDKVKIDKSFVRDIAEDPRAASYVEAIIRLGTSLHMEVTAEGIEDRHVVEKLAQLGCTFGQGHLFAKPMPAAELPQVLERLTGREIAPNPLLLPDRILT